MERRSSDEGKPEEKIDDFALVKNIIKDILSEDLREIEIKLESRFDDLGFDSIKFIGLILNLEDVVDKDIDDIVSEIDLSSLQTVSDVVNFIKGLKSR